MMAAAMRTRNSRVPLYAELAKTAAKVRREVPPTACGRLQRAVQKLQSPYADLQFGQDAQRRPRVWGSVAATVVMDCQLCSEPLEFSLLAQIDALLAADEQQAAAWQAQDAAVNVVVLSTAELDLIELVEDELLLELPTRVCGDETCERRPEMSYGPLAASSHTETYKPFAGLAALQSRPGEHNEIDDP